MRTEALKIWVKNMAAGEDTNFLRKKEIRANALLRRDTLTEEERIRYSTRIREKLTGSRIYEEAGRILVFVSFGSEVDTLQLLEDAWKKRKEVYCPRVEGEELCFYRVYSIQDLEPGYRGILEPVAGLKPYVQKGAEPVLLLMPGTVFDRNRNRIGYGKGFYDRFLDRCGKCVEGKRFVTVGLAYSVQIVGDVPYEEHDYKPDYVITETEVLNDSKGDWKWI